MKLSVFLVLLPAVSAFVTPSMPTSAISGDAPTTPLSASTHRSSTSYTRAVPPLRASQKPVSDEATKATWSVSSMWRGMVGSASQTKIKVDTTTAEVYAELKKKVLVKQERQTIEGKLCSLIRIEGGDMSCKAEEHVRRLASELEALQDNATVFGLRKTGLAGCWKLIYSSAGCGGRNGKGADHLKSIEEISYVSENFRISHTDSGVLRVCKRVSTSVRSTGGASAEDDTGANVAAMMMSDAGGEGKKAGRASATAAGRAPRRTAPLRKRMFLGWLRR